jgi:hypothetical protein
MRTRFDKPTNGSLGTSNPPPSCVRAISDAFLIQTKVVALILMLSLAVPVSGGIAYPGWLYAFSFLAAVPHTFTSLKKENRVFIVRKPGMCSEKRLVLCWRIENSSPNEASITGRVCNDKKIENKDKARKTK